MPRRTPILPPAMQEALCALGADLSAARRRRRLRQQIVAERAFTTRHTVARVERGDPSVSMGTWVAVLFALGLGDRIGKIAPLADDTLGNRLAMLQLPKRVRLGWPTKTPDTTP